MTLTDEELDRDWKPSGRRPQSTIARSFSAELMDIFRIENSVADLDMQVDKRKQEINSRTSELEALEARIREMEARLQRGKALQGQPSQQQQQQQQQLASPPNSTGAASGSSPRYHPRAPVSGAFHQGATSHQQQQQAQTESREGQASKYGSRPGTARASQQAVPGALPPTPTESEDGDRERDS